MHGEKAKAVKAIVKSARKAKRAKDYDTAIKLYQKAKNGYAELLKDAKAIPDLHTSSAGSFSSSYYNGSGGGGGMFNPDKKYSSRSKIGFINWCIRKMGDCDNAIEAIKNKQAKNIRNAKLVTESYSNEYDTVIESLYDDDDYEDYDDFEDYDDEHSLESLML